MLAKQYDTEKESKLYEIIVKPCEDGKGYYVKVEGFNWISWERIGDKRAIKHLQNVIKLLKNQIKGIF